MKTTINRREFVGLAAGIAACSLAGRAAVSTNFDFGGPACGSASRMFFGNHPALTDWNLGFRVVLVPGPR